MKLTLHTTLLAGIALAATATATADDKWIAPTKEELAMTSQPEVPGAPAVYLFREESTEDTLHMWSHYVRLKVLTEEGKKYGDVRIAFMKGNEDYAGYAVDSIDGRTIQSDGTIVPFSGKPYEKLVEKGNGIKMMQKVFSLPAVQVGSIIEYRYKLRWDDNWFRSPDWFPQDDLYTRKAHYVWKTRTIELVHRENGHEEIVHSIAWAPVLPEGAKVVNTTTPNGDQLMELTITNVKPQPEEPLMPPIANFSYRVYFYYTNYHSAEEYWKTEGKFWNSQRDKFIGPNNGVRAFVTKTVTPGMSKEVALHLLYEEIMKMENISYTRKRAHQEEKKAVKNTDDVLANGYGSDDQLTMLFIAMARAAGMKAYAMDVVDRSRSMFLMSYLTFNQFSDTVAIVDMDGKEKFFDPGSRYMPFGHLDWRHTMTSGIRQSAAGAIIAQTPPEGFAFTSTQRVADLTMDQHGATEGKVDITFSGQSAVNWRHRALLGDEESLKDQWRKYIENIFPGGAEVTVGSIEGINDTETPLKVHFTIKSQLGKATSSRLIFPSDIFISQRKPTFTAEKRETFVDFDYPEQIQDAMRIKFPANFAVEAEPKTYADSYLRRIAYNIKSQQSDKAITIWRNMVYGDPFFQPAEYSGLHAFFNKFENVDQDPVVLKAEESTTQAAPGGR